MAERQEELYEEFLDVVFGHESIVEKREWLKKVDKKLDYVVDPIKIRQKLNIKMKIQCSK